MRMAEKSLLLQILDQQWKIHLLSLDHLRQGIGLRAYAQRDPLNEYKREAFDMFNAMLSVLRETMTTVLSHIELRVAPEPDDGFSAAPPRRRVMNEGRGLPGEGGGTASPPFAPASARPASPWGKVGRNKPCPCGSGKKYKHCHGKVA